VCLDWRKTERCQKNSPWQHSRRGGGVTALNNSGFIRSFLEIEVKRGEREREEEEGEGIRSKTGPLEKVRVGQL
jgi:hypothetical protein